MLNADDLLEQATQRTGLSDFGEAPLREGLAVLCEALIGEARLNDNGVVAARDDILGILEQRLKVEEWYRQAPEIGDQQIIKPIMVTGLPRSGTSALSQMLAQDHENRSIRRWEGAQPTPPPDIATEANDPRIAETQAMLDRRYAASPEMMAMNPVTVSDPTENECFLKHSFECLVFTGIYNVPSYQQWALQRDMRPSYRYLLRVLKLLQWRRPPTRWNLKFPIDLFHLDAIADVIPDARLVWTHRNPVKTVPSVASLLVARRRPMTDVIDRVELGRSEFAFRLEQIRRGLAYRDRSDALPIIDLRNEDLIRDATGSVRSLYQQLGLDFTPRFEQALGERIAERPKGKFGAHNYTAEEFGLDEDELEKAFAPYIERFQL